MLACLGWWVRGQAGRQRTGEHADALQVMEVHRPHLGLNGLPACRTGLQAQSHVGQGSGPSSRLSARSITLALRGAACVSERHAALQCIACGALGRPRPVLCRS